MKLEVKIKYPVQTDDNKVKDEVVSFLVTGENFSEAEALAYEVAPDGAVVTHMTPNNVENIVNHSFDLEGVMPFYLCENKDEVDYDDKKTKRTIKALVHAVDTDHALECFKSHLEMYDAALNITKMQKTIIEKIITPHEVDETTEEVVEE